MTDLNTKKYLQREGKPNLAYVYNPGSDTNLPTVMFLGGFKSDMEGTKALHLENYCKLKNQSFMRFDYSGHGVSEGQFENGTISIWAQDAQDMLDMVINGPVVLVGSSMGGWISLLLALRNRDRVSGVIGIAAAPDFTTWMRSKLTNAQSLEMDNKGYIAIPNDYSDEPYIITKALLDDGDRNLLLHGSIDLDIPVHLIQGKQDADVPWEVAEQIQSCISTQSTEVIFVNDGDHRLSRPEDLEVIENNVKTISAYISSQG